MKTLHAPNLVLEPLVAAHAREMFPLLQDPAIYEFENEPPPSAEWLEDRYKRLEQRGPASRTEQWLNWVVRLPAGPLVGYVQATVLPDHTALVAYELNSRHWRQGLATAAVQTLMNELVAGYGVCTVVAVLKAANFRSAGLLRKLGFTRAAEAWVERFREEADEWVMVYQR